MTTRTDVATAHIITLVDEYEATALRLGELVRDNAPVQDRFPLYRELIDLAHQLAALLHERGDHYRRRTDSWREGLDRLRRYT